MHRPARSLRRTSLLAAFATVAAGHAVLFGLAPAGAAENPNLVTVPPVDRYVPRADYGIGGGVSGFLHSEESDTGDRLLLWTRFDDGSTSDADPYFDTTARVADGENIAIVPINGGVASVTFRNMLSGDERDVPIPAGQTYLLPTGDAVVTKKHVPAANGAAQYDEVHLVDTTADYVVKGFPAGSLISGSPAQVGNDEFAVLLRYTVPKPDGTVDYKMAYVDTLSVTVKASYPSDISAFRTPVLTADHVLWSDRDGTVWRTPRTGGGVAERIGTCGRDCQPVGAVGNWLLTLHGWPASDPRDLVATPFAGGESRTVLHGVTSAIPDNWNDGLIAVGGDDAQHTAIRRVTVSEDAAAEPVLSTLRSLPAMPARTRSFTVAGRRLLTIDDSTASGSAVAERDLGPAGPLNVGDRHVLTTENRAENIAASGLRTAYEVSGSDPKVVVHNRNGAIRAFRVGGSGVTPDLQQLSGRTMVYRGSSSPSAVDAEAGASFGTDHLGVLQGSTSWGPAGDVATTGRFEAVDLRAKAAGSTAAPRTVVTAARCAVSTYDVVAHWVYWRCGDQPTDPAGVYDVDTGRNLAVPGGPGALGDGFLVQRGAYNLMVTDLTAAGSPSTRVLADTDDWHPYFTVDREGGQVVAYRADGGKIEVVSVDVPASALTVLDSWTPPALTVAKGGETWEPEWDLSKQSTWTLQLSTAKSEAVRTLTGTSAGTSVAASWDGRTSDGGPLAADGAYTWKLTAKPADGVGADLVRTGTVGLRARPVRVPATAPKYATDASATRTFTVAWGPRPDGVTGVDVDACAATSRRPDGTPAYGTCQPWLRGTKAASAAYTGKGGTAVRFVVRPVDAWGGTVTATSASTYVPVDDQAVASQFAGSWTRVQETGALLGKLRSATAAGATFTLTKAGGSVAVIGDRCRACGRFRVYVDNALTATVDTYAATTRYRQPLWTADLAAGRHTVTVKVVGTAHRPAVRLDAFAALP